MRSLALKPAALTGFALLLLAIGTASHAQTQSKSFGKIEDGPNSVTVKAARSTVNSQGAKTGKRGLEVIVYRSLDTSDYFSDTYYTDQEAKSFRSALIALSARYQQWKGKHLGTQQQEIEIRKANDGASTPGAIIDLQMDEMGKIALVFTQGTVSVETSAANLAKFRSMVENAGAWLAGTPGAGVGKKLGK